MKQMKLAVQFASVLVAAVWMDGALAQAPASNAAIYACTDAKGRRITSDRPIVDCIDREQRVLGSTGVELRRLSPSLTEEERQAQEARRRQKLAEQARLREERARDRALLVRYPNQAVHDAARSEALKHISDVKEVAQQRLAELKQRRTQLDTELEFYQNDVAKAPAKLRNQIRGNTESQQEQLRFLQQQDMERKRVNQRFDEELQQLRKLWNPEATAP